MWLGLLAFMCGAGLAPARAQGPPGAFAAATGAAAAATAAAPAPKKTAASAALDAAVMGNTAVTRAKPSDLAMTAQSEEANNSAAPAAPLTPAAAPAPPLKGIAGECANLLKMATDLKNEVDKTTKDVLSVAVIRDAGQIEETAKKMRQQQH